MSPVIAQATHKKGSPNSMAKQARYYQDKIAVVTGAGSGIGRAIAQRLATHGARVHCADIDGEAAQSVAAGLSNAQAYTLDVADSDAVAAFAAEIYASDGRVDLLFNNAGIGHAGLIADSELDDWRRQLDINVMGVVHGLHAFLPRMQAQTGTSHIINTASAAGLIALPRMAPYCAAKHAVVGLSQSLAAELHDSPIGVTILCPGTINTAIVERTQMRGNALKNQARAVSHYARKGASPDQVAEDVLHDVRKGRLFCVTPRSEVGLGWLAQRISPAFTHRLLRHRIRALLGAP